MNPEEKDGPVALTKATSQETGKSPQRTLSGGGFKFPAKYLQPGQGQRKKPQTALFAPMPHSEEKLKSAKRTVKPAETGQPPAKQVPPSSPDADEHVVPTMGSSTS